MIGIPVNNSRCAFCGKVKPELNVVGEDLICTDCQRLAFGTDQNFDNGFRPVEFSAGDPAKEAL